MFITTCEISWEVLEAPSPGRLGRHHSPGATKGVALFISWLGDKLKAAQRLLVPILNDISLNQNLIKVHPTNIGMLLSSPDDLETLA